MSDRPFSLADDGDSEERRYWPLFIRQYFPSYETFWVARVVPLTDRVKHRSAIGFRTDWELKQAGFADKDVAVAQLHYTLLLHLGRVFDLLSAGQIFVNPSPLPNRPFGRHEFFECMTRLSGASDVADEILERRADPGTYSAWSEADGGRACFAWRKTNQDPLQPIRAYRNRLVHGRVIPELWVNVLDAQSGENLGAALYYPRLDKADDYLDWRVAFAPRALPGPGSAVVDTSPPPEFDEAAPIALHAWELTVIYVEAAWRMHLLPHL